jgi:hypothetical protein
MLWLVPLLVFGDGNVLLLGQLILCGTAITEKQGPIARLLVLLGAAIAIVFSINTACTRATKS